MVAGMSAVDRVRDAASPRAATTSGASPVHRSSSERPVPVRHGTIVIVGGGCYGSYYLRQLGRARSADALTWERLIVVDRDAGCRVAREATGGVEIVVRDWAEFFADFLGGAALDPAGAAHDAVVPSPLMPHLLFDWVAARARERWPARPIEVLPLDTPPNVPWQRASPDGATHYVSFAEWMCPINCIEPDRCPATREARTWTMPAALAQYVGAERARGHDMAGPFVFHCTHRAYGVGMIDVTAVVDADSAIRVLGERGPADILVGTVSHCHGAIGRLRIT
jgi:hypothetical protein